MRRQFSQGMLTPFQRPDPTSGVEAKIFEGSADRVQFVAPMPGYLSRGGAHVQELAVVRGSNGLNLQFRFAQLNGFEADEGISAEVEPVVLMDGLGDARFEYRSVEDGELSDWSSDWEQEFRLPAMVRLVVEFRQGDARKWPAFEVAMPGGGVNPTLTFDNMRRSGAPNDPRARQAP